MINLRNVKYKLRYKGDKIIFVNPTILLDKLEKTSYGVRKPSGQIGNRVQRAKEYILKYWDDPRAKKFPMFEPSVVGMYGSPGMEYVSFGDGRHRILAAEELGIPEVAIEIPRRQEPKFEYMKVKSTNESLNNNDIKTKFKKDILLPLKREALKFDKFQDFQDSYSIYGNHGLYFHITHDPNWKYDSEKGSRDMSSMASGQINKGSFMVTSNLDHWDYNYNYDENDKPRKQDQFSRNYVALIDLGDVNYYIGFGRGFGHEIFIKPTEAEKAIILDVVPITEGRKIYKKYKNKQPKNTEELYKIWKEVHEKINEEIIYTHMITKFENFINENNNLSFDRDSIFKITGQAPLDFDENPGYVSFKTLSPAGARSAVRKLIDSGYDAKVTMGRYIKIEKS